MKFIHLFVNILILIILTLIGSVGCNPTVFKDGALDSKLLKKRPVPGNLVKTSGNGKQVVEPDILWMSGIDSSENLAFAGLRQKPDSVTYCLVIECDPVEDSLVLWPLAPEETPVSVLLDENRLQQLKHIIRNYSSLQKDSTHIIRTSIKDVISKRILGTPLPEPTHIYAVAANYPSHLKFDLAIKNIEENRKILEKGRARVFLKYPATRPPFIKSLDVSAFTGLLGPFDEICYPDKVTVPLDAEGHPGHKTGLQLDYEVEIGVVFGKKLTRENIENFSDDEILATVIGWVLINDTKSRNPQAMTRVLDADRLSALENPYRLGDEYLDKVLGIWNEKTCQWWSYAASWGKFTSIGPFLVACQEDFLFQPRGLISARSYGPDAERKFPIPDNNSEDILYLRQCSMLTVDKNYPDRIIWDIPEIVRSILEPGSALSFMDPAPSIEAGDIICMGTPGGTVITSKPYYIFDIAEDVAFWKEPLFWHDKFLRDNSYLYLHQGDKLFLWGEGLGFQILSIKQINIE
jgi:2-keto-4-pentenoate hydratase/2-oxohepta-3-ene-1,7-dioic acid hydratase in catechol pathway